MRCGIPEHDHVVPARLEPLISATLLDKVLATVKAGLCPTSAARYHLVTEAELYEATRADPDFARRLAAAEATAEWDAVVELREGATLDGKVGSKAAVQFFLERRFPERWGRGAEAGEWQPEAQGDDAADPLVAQLERLAEGDSA